jgi:hypothetical protein
MNLATIATLHGKLCSAQIRPFREGPTGRSQVELLPISLCHICIDMGDRNSLCFKAIHESRRDDSVMRRQGRPYPR